MVGFKYLLIFFLFFTHHTNSLLAETTGNLLTNGNFENGNSNGWTTSGEVVVLNDCCGSNYDLEIGLQGSIEQEVNLTSDTITQQMLDNGITLNSSVLVQNGECGVAQCWGGSGPADTFTIRLQIKDSNNNVLATTTQERTNVTGINGKDFTDSLSYTESGSNRGNIFISGSDGNGVAGGLGGPNFDNISLTLDYDPTVLTANQTAELTATFQEIEEIVEITEELIPSTVLTSNVEFTQVEEYLPEEVFVETIIEMVKLEEEKFVEENIVLEIYEEPTTIEEVSTEVESFEERIETTEVEPEEEIIEQFESASEPTEETTVASAEETESTRTREEESEVESVAESSESTQSSESSGEEIEQSEERDSTSETEVSQQDSESEGDTGNQTSNNTQDRADTTTLTVEEVAKKVNTITKRLDLQLVATQQIVAKSISSAVNVDDYANVNDDLFKNQPILVSSIPNEYIIDYKDERQIYANKKAYNDVFQRFTQDLENAEDNLIRAEEHLRRIRGY